MHKLLIDLQESFAFIDLVNKSSKHGFMELLIKKLLPIEFRMEQDANHKMPHLHINYGKEKHVASYAINGGERLAGNLDTKYDKAVKVWISKNQVQLNKIWIAIQAGDQKKYELLIGNL